MLFVLAVCSDSDMTSAVYKNDFAKGKMKMLSLDSFLGIFLSYLIVKH